MATKADRVVTRGSADLGARQITELAHAFRAFTSQVPGLSVEVVGHVAGDRRWVHPVAGFHVRLKPGHGAGVALYVSSQYGELVKWGEGAGALRERFDVSMSDPGYGWGGSEYPTAHQLAHDLVAYMQFNLDAMPRN